MTFAGYLSNNGCYGGLLGPHMYGVKFLTTEFEQPDATHQPLTSNSLYGLSSTQYEPGDSILLIHLTPGSLRLV